MPFWMAQVLMMTSSSRIMGAAFVNARSTKALAWAISAAVILINGWLTYVFAAENLSQSPVSIAALCVGVVAYLAFVTYLVIGPEHSCKDKPFRCLLSPRQNSSQLSTAQMQRRSWRQVNPPQVSKIAIPS